MLIYSTNFDISPPRFLGKDYCFHQFRSFVSSFVRQSGRFWANRLLLFSEILPKVAPQYLVVHLRFSIFLKISIPRFQPILAIFQGFSNILGKPRISFFSNFHTSSSRVIGYPLQQPIVCKKSSSWLKSRFCHQKTPNQQQIIHCFLRKLMMGVLLTML